jgi:NAD(P)-dependent dehydrogenase (short-subunit alcohol dehydrogenase family)
VARLFDTNVHGPFTLISLAVPHMRAVGGGSIVNFTSGEGALRPFDFRKAPTAKHGIGALLGYASSKAALERLSNALAPELAAENIAIACVNPGLTRTELIDIPIERGTMDAAAAHPMEVPVKTALDFITADNPLACSGSILQAGETLSRLSAS